MAGMPGIRTPGGAPVPDLPKLRGRRVTDICAPLDLDEPVASLVNDAHTPTGFLALLIERDHLFDATRFLAQALPKREAVWWACLCTRTTFRDAVMPATAAAIAAAEAWVYKPTDENRRAAVAVTTAMKKLNTGAAWAAMAAGWSQAASTGVPADAPSLPNELTGHAVTASLTLSAVELGRAKMDETLMSFLRKGMELAGAAPVQRGG
jgi:hypothetical protein